MFAKTPRTRIARAARAVLLPVRLLSFFAGTSVALAAAPSLPVSQLPLTITIPAHPQILFAIANSQSMDGDLGGAIWTGAGGLGSNYSLLNASSSPINYTIPNGFTPPVLPGGSGVAPYTATVSGNQVDNSASRLNVAKAGILAILNTYLSTTDFALMDFDTSGNGYYATWVYQMSPQGGFVFTSTAVAGNRYVANPCYNYLAQPAANQMTCPGVAAHYAAGVVNASRLMQISASSDDPAINDVLYAPTGYVGGVCVAGGGATPPSPYYNALTNPTGFTLAQYNAGSITENYAAGYPSCVLQTGPTNAGYVPYSTEVMYELRGFGFYTGGENATDGKMLLNMTSSGATPTQASVTAAYNLFAPYLAPETSSTGTNEIKAQATQSPLAGLIAQATTYLAGSNPPASSNGCKTSRYVVLLTDGLPTMDLAGKNWPPLGSAAAAGYGVNASFNTDGSLNTTNDQALTDVIMNLKTLAADGVNTYIVGLGAGVDPAVNPTAAATLKAMAIAGGTSNYFAASSPAALVTDLQTIVATIQQAAQSVASAAVNSTHLNGTSAVYQSQFLDSDSYQDWTGNLFEFPIDATTGAVNTAYSNAQWSAQTLLDAKAPASRIIATWDPAANAATPFEWTGGTPTSGIASSTLLGQDLASFAADPSGLDVLNYLRGSTALEQRNGGQFRNRSHILGDIVSSNPLYIGTPTGLSQSSAYLNFVTNNGTRPAVIYVGANDGMLHAFDAATGSERFAYVPRGVYAKLINLVSPYYNAQHQFFVNGSPQASDLQFSDGSWHTLLVGTEGAGGNSVFALDVSDPGSLTSETALAHAALWDFTEADMGLTFSNPALANTTNGWQVFVGNGYNSTRQTPVLYALNPQTGAVNAKIDLCAAVTGVCNTSFSNGLSSPIAINTGGALTGAANVVYAGDLQGNMWRVNISNTNPALWTVSVVFQARDSQGNFQPITTTPVASLNPKFPQTLGTMVFFGTGEFVGLSDLTNSNVQSIYGVYDPPSGYATPLTRASLIQQSLSNAMIGSQQVQVVTGNGVSIPTNKGWYIDLTLNSGERIINDPRLETGGALVLTSYDPSANLCSGGGNSHLYVINYATGGAFPSPQFDANGDGAINNSDVVTNANGSTSVPVGMSLGAVYASSPTIQTGDFGTGSAIKLITESSAAGNPSNTAGVIKSVIEKGTTKHRTAWWEVRQ